MLHVRRARIPAALLPASLASSAPDPLEPTVVCDVVISGHEIASVVASDTRAAPAGARILDLDGALVFPGFVDAHTHLDKTHTWLRAPNRTHTFADALESLGRDKVNWTEEDLLRRARFALRSAWAHGTRALRTHVDTALPWAKRSHAVMAELRREWLGKIPLQTVPLFGGDAVEGRNGDEIADIALTHGATALGGFFWMNPDLPRQVERLLALARARNVGIDLHVDENGDAGAECLRAVAEAVLRTRFPHPVVCGHCCSLARQPVERARSTVELVREARIGIISLPLCNLYLQDRRSAGREFPRTPLWRGLTLVQDFMDAGVTVACASDNVRDAFYAYGDYDLAEVYAASLRLAHLDARLAESVTIMTRAAADLIGRPDYGRVAPGARAHLVVFPARRFSEFLSRPTALRRCIDGEEIHQPAAPDYAELHDPLR
jgi:cytosine deaminase